MSACYRSTHPDVLAAWDDSQRRYRETHESIRAICERFDAQAMVSSGSTYALAGIVTSDGEPPEGGTALWRRDRRVGAWVPLRKTKEGEALGKEFDACSARNLGVVPGLPLYVRDKAEMFRFRGAQVFGDGGAVWACWMHCDHEDVVDDKTWGSLDESMWQQAKRSEFYAAQEAHQGAAS